MDPVPLSTAQNKENGEADKGRGRLPSHSGAGLRRVGVAPASPAPPHLAWALPLPGVGGLWAVPAPAGPRFVFLGVLG